MNTEEQLFAARGIRPTAVRLLVLRCFKEQEAAISLKFLEEQLYWADKSTLFRSLKTFEEKGLVHSIADGTGLTKYALCLESCQCLPKDQHFHFHCQKCSQTFCLPKQSLPAIQLPPKFKLEQANLVLQGLCANCS